MEKVISFCGLTCSECPAFLATHNNDDTVRKSTAEQWSKQYGAEIKPGEINCKGCVSTGNVHFSHCSECEIRACGKEKGLGKNYLKRALAGKDFGRDAAD